MYAQCILCLYFVFFPMIYNVNTNTKAALGYVPMRYGHHTRVIFESLLSNPLFVCGSSHCHIASLGLAINHSLEDVLVF